MPMRRARRSLVYAAVLPLLLASGCGGDDDDPEPIVTEPPPSASPSPSASPAAQREPWERRTKAGAVAFVEHWVEVFNEASATGTVHELRALSGGECRTCSNFIATIQDLYAAGGRIDSEGWSVVETAVEPTSKTGAPRGALNVDRSAQVVTSEDGSVERFNGGTATIAFELRWRSGEWQMIELDMLA